MIVGLLQGRHFLFVVSRQGHVQRRRRHCTDFLGQVLFQLFHVFHPFQRRVIRRLHHIYVGTSCFDGSQGRFHTGDGFGAFGAHQVAGGLNFFLAIDHGFFHVSYHGFFVLGKRGQKSIFHIVRRNGQIFQPSFHIVFQILTGTAARIRHNGGRGTARLGHGIGGFAKAFGGVGFLLPDHSTVLDGILLVVFCHSVTQRRHFLKRLNHFVQFELQILCLHLSSGNGFRRLRGGLGTDAVGGVSRGVGNGNGFGDGGMFRVHHQGGRFFSQSSFFLPFHVNPQFQRLLFRFHVRLRLFHGLFAGVVFLVQELCFLRHAFHVQSNFFFSTVLHVSRFPLSFRRFQLGHFFQCIGFGGGRVVVIGFSVLFQFLFQFVVFVGVVDGVCFLFRGHVNVIVRLIVVGFLVTGLLRIDHMNVFQRQICSARQDVGLCRTRLASNGVPGSVTDRTTTVNTTATGHAIDQLRLKLTGGVAAVHHAVNQRLWQNGTSRQIIDPVLIAFGLLQLTGHGTFHLIQTQPRSLPTFVGDS